MPLMFEQLPRETNKAFAAFKAYLDMGSERSLALVAANLGKSKVMMERWSRKYDWSGRVSAHAGHVAAVERAAQEATVRAEAAEWAERRKALKQREWAIHDKCIAAAERGLAAFMEREKVYANLADIARILEVASKLGRMSSGLATETVEQKTEVDVNFRIEVETAVKKAYGEVIDVEVVPEPRKELNDARP